MDYGGAIDHNIATDVVFGAEVIMVTDGDYHRPCTSHWALNLCLRRALIRPLPSK